MVAVAHALDAVALDTELEALLHSLWEQAWCDGVGASTWERLKPELSALLRGVMWWFSMGVGSRTAGMALLNLHCAPTAESRRCLPWRPAHLGSPSCASPAALSRSQRVLHALLVVLLPWAWARAMQRVTTQDSPRAARLLRLMRRLETAVALATVGVSARFLVARQSPTLPMVLSGMKLQYTDVSKPRRPAFEFMEQQLAWSALADILLVVRRLWHLSPRALPRPAASATENDWWGGWGPLLTDWGLIARSSTEEYTVGCALCGADPVHSSQLSACGHEFCYYCIATTCMASTSATCPRCRARLRIAEQVG
ncbi:hypothetical protein AB1Y20_007237 [Prymnesium parvum]|uniref:RING-type E3 ubiquitin transferase (cysteine targeting) n=1 Tax=Prymnesium parvum TaxID=97485 RepID=A0AB34IX69_PRYPA